jgi:hypothetical protein
MGESREKRRVRSVVNGFVTIGARYVTGCREEKELFDKLMMDLHSTEKAVGGEKKRA